MMIDLIIWDFDGVLAQTSDNWAERDYPLTDGVRDILALPNLKHCIATNGTLEQTLEKIALCGWNDVFSENNIFTIDMAGVGKSSPIIFMLAMLMMGATTDNTIVIDDSYTAMKGALEACCLPIAFLNRERFEHSEWPERLRKLGVKHIFSRMSDVKECIKTIKYS